MINFVVVFISLFLCGCASSALSPTQANNLAQIDVSLAVDALAHNDPFTAKEKLLSALQLAPNSSSVQAAWGYYLWHVGDLANADQAYARALALAPDDPQIQDDYAVFLYQEKKYAQALPYFLKAAMNENYLYTGLAYQNASLTASHLGDAKLAAFYQQKALAESE